MILTAESEAMARRTPSGMAHWAGTGPAATTCRGCDHARDARHKGALARADMVVIGIINVRCAKYFELMKKWGDAFRSDMMSCRHFRGREHGK